MRSSHLMSGGRYPVLRTLAILYMLSAVAIVIYGIWQAFVVLLSAVDTTEGKVVVAVGWVAGSILAALAAIGIGELIKLLIDIEHNTRALALRGTAFPISTTTATAAAAASTDATVAHDGPGFPVIGDREKKWIDGDETAEGALLRGH